MHAGASLGESRMIKRRRSPHKLENFAGGGGLTLYQEFAMSRFVERSVRLLPRLILGWFVLLFVASIVTQYLPVRKVLVVRYSASKLEGNKL